MPPTRPPIPPQRPLPSNFPPVTQHQQLYNPDPDHEPPKSTKPVVPPNMLVNPLTGIQVLHYDEAMLLYQAADAFYTRLGHMSSNMILYGPICMVCRSAVVALRSAKQVKRPLKGVLDEWYERLEKEKRMLGMTTMN